MWACQDLEANSITFLASLPVSIVEAGLSIRHDGTYALGRAAQQSSRGIFEWLRGLKAVFCFNICHVQDTRSTPCLAPDSMAGRWDLSALPRTSPLQIISVTSLRVPGNRPPLPSLRSSFPSQICVHQTPNPKRHQAQKFIVKHPPKRLTPSSQTPSAVFSERTSPSY